MSPLLPAEQGIILRGNFCHSLMAFNGSVLKGMDSTGESGKTAP